MARCSRIDRHRFAILADGLVWFFGQQVKIAEGDVYVSDVGLRLQRLVIPFQHLFEVAAIRIVMAHGQQHARAFAEHVQAVLQRLQRLFWPSLLQLQGGDRAVEQGRITTLFSPACSRATASSARPCAVRIWLPVMYPGVSFGREGDRLFIGG